MNAVVKHLPAHAGLEKGITMVVFDRGGFRYEGRVKARTSHFVEKTIAGWWFGTFFIFPYIGNNHPN